MFESLLKKIIAIDGITGCITVDPQDGSVLLKEGDINPLLEDITAFFGSGFDVVASSLGIKRLKFSYLEKENQKFVILVKEGGYIGCELSSDIAFEVVMKKIQGIEKTDGEMKEPEKVSVSSVGELSQQTRFLDSKVNQINLLIDEFSDREDRVQWIELVREKFYENEIGKKMISVIHFDNNKVIFEGNLDPETKEEDISIVSKLVTDSLCRKAVEKFGAIEAKKKVHNVIEKLGITK
ncbi:MAG: hypothetical protein E3J87_04465 [Candidatus Cloacimonadota bacterium]|nr:MAG: hypothetical protein E3J87_04465 [Candidatus Cloacimonadota bacterium]